MPLFLLAQEVEKPLPDALAAKLCGLVIEKITKPLMSVRIDECILSPGSVAPFPSFAHLELVNINLNSTRAKGFFMASFKGKGRNTRLLFNYVLNGSAEVLVATQDIERESELKDIAYKSLELDAIPRDFAKSTLGYESLLRIKEGQIIRQSMIRRALIIKKGAWVTGIAQFEGISASIELEALQGGVKGQVIRLKSSDGKLFSGEVLSENRVSIK